MKTIALREIAEDMESDVYWHNAKCSNCHAQTSFAFEKGKLISAHVCPDCLNQTLISIKY